MQPSDQIRRIVTGHDQSGKAIVTIDGANPHKIVRPRTGTVNRLIWATDRAPADMSGDADRAATHVGIAPAPGGSVFRIVDFPPTTDAEIATFEPGFLSKQIPHEDHGPSRYREPSHPFMHRTRSVDYAIVLSGEIDMKLDEEEIHLRAGDVLVQQGTNHAWINRSGAVCRIAFVLIDAADPLAG
jgi:mannose-6-phosphate isomerase-like protein (cupin superfamily)